MGFGSVITLNKSNWRWRCRIFRTSDCGDLWSVIFSGMPAGRGAAAFSDANLLAGLKYWNIAISFSYIHITLLYLSFQKRVVSKKSYNVKGFKLTSQKVNGGQSELTKWSEVWRVWNFVKLIFLVRVLYNFGWMATTSWDFKTPFDLEILPNTPRYCVRREYMRVLPVWYWARHLKQ